MEHRVGMEVHYLIVQRTWPGSSHWLICDVPSSLGCTSESEFVSRVVISNHFKQSGNF
jgi:hypothetical protein